MIETVKQKIQEKDGTSPEEQTLIFRNLAMENNQPLTCYHFGNEDTLSCAYHDQKASLHFLGQGIALVLIRKRA